MEKKIKINEDNLNMLKKNLMLKDEAMNSIKNKNIFLEQQCNDMKTFILNNCTPEQREQFKKSWFY